MVKEIYTSFNLLEMGWLPDNWVFQIVDVVEKHAKHTQFDGTSVTSREPASGERAEVHLVTGDQIKEHLFWLFDLYENKLCQLVSTLAAQPVYPSVDLVSSININALKGRGSRYEWHVDTNPLTGLLYVTTHSTSDGGELVFEKDDIRTLVHPEAGIFIAFDARQIPHTVAPLKTETVRISVPMNYYFSTAEQARPADLDQYLYEPSS